jgi:deoxyribodipyrimidine photo-lyase
MLTGGDWFESQLLDYDVYSNWFNWCSGAGMTGGRLNRFNIAKQSKDYDQHGEYVKLWCPELKNLPKEFVHEPWKMNQFQQMEFKCKLGVDYPNPVVPPSQPKYGGGGNGGPKKGGKPKDNNRNRHQKQDMKSLKQGDFKMR